MAGTLQNPSYTEGQILEIAARFKTFREDYVGGLQSDLALELKSTQKHVSFIETGRALPNQRIINHLSKKYGLNPDWLVSGKGEPKTKEINKKDHTANMQTRIALLEQQVSSLQKLVKEVLAELQKES